MYSKDLVVSFNAGVRINTITVINMDHIELNFFSIGVCLKCGQQLIFSQKMHNISYERTFLS